MSGTIASAVKGRLRKWHRDTSLATAVRSMRRQAHTGRDLSHDSVAKLIYGWGNEGWSGSSDLARATYRYCKDLKGDVLECGSGMTTIMLAALGEAGGFRAWALEHEQVWHAQVCERLVHHRFDASRILYTPLRSHGDFDWYDLSRVDMPSAIQFVLCDGPPGSTRGGRYGMLDVLRDRLSPGAVILVDDTNREAETKMIEQWLAVAPDKISVVERSETYVALRVS